MLPIKFRFIWLRVSEEKIKVWKVNGRQTTDAKWWQKLTLPLARWAKNEHTCNSYSEMSVKWLLPGSWEVLFNSIDKENKKIKYGWSNLINTVISLTLYVFSEIKYLQYTEQLDLVSLQWDKIPKLHWTMPDCLYLFRDKT